MNFEKMVDNFIGRLIGPKDLNIVYRLITIIPGSTVPILKTISRFDELYALPYCFVRDPIVGELVQCSRTKFYFKIEDIIHCYCPEPAQGNSMAYMEIILKQVFPEESNVL